MERSYPRRLTSEFEDVGERISGRGAGWLGTVPRSCWVKGRPGEEPGLSRFCCPLSVTDFRSVGGLRHFRPPGCPGLPVGPQGGPVGLGSCCPLVHSRGLAGRETASGRIFGKIPLVYEGVNNQTRTLGSCATVGWVNLNFHLWISNSSLIYIPGKP